MILNFAFLIFNFDKAAAAGLSIGIYPPLIQIETLPPANVNSKITIQNLGDNPVDLEITLKPFIASKDQNGQVEYIPQDQSFGEDPLILQRVQIIDEGKTIKNITLAPLQKKDLTLNINIPSEESLGDYYFSVIFSAIPEAQNTEANPSLLVNQSQSVGGVATNVLLSVSSETKETPQGVIETFSSPIFLEKGPVPFTVSIKNTGRYFITPQGSILIKNIFGQTVGKVNLLPVNILSNSTRLLPDELQSPESNPSTAELNAKRYTLNATKAFWPETFLLGPYQATLNVSLSDQGPIFKRSIYFFALPLQSLIGLAIAAIVFVLIRSKIRKRNA
ncbi:MAG: DUF916 domain-containing protein [Candidatus Levybacteria bacterium]|nr:DUF916 domain-containing protein [Candidatus Levybacteria bacterium]